MELTTERALQQGVAAHKEGKLQEAERFYRAILQSQPTHPDANHNLGVLAVSINKAQVALPLFKTALESNPKIEQFWLSYIDALIKEKQFDNVKQVIEQGKKQGVAGEKLDALQSRLKETLVDSKNNITAYHELIPAIKLLEEGRYQEAQEWINRFIENDSSDAEAWSLLSQVLLLDNKISESQQVLLKAASINSELSSISRNHARLLLKQSKPKEALEKAQSGYDRSSDDPESSLVLAACLAANQRDQEALSLIERALEARSNYAEAFASRSLIRFRAKDLPKAIEDAEMAVSIKPHLTQIWGLLGALRYQSNNLSGAIKALKQAYKLEPTNPRYVSELGEFLRLDNQVAEAIAVLRDGTKLTPENSNIWANLGVAYQQDKNTEDAKAAYGRALDINPKLAEVWSNLGAIAKDVKDYNSALQYFEKSVEYKPDLAEAHSNLGVTLRDLGRLEEAEASYRQAISLKPDYAEAHSNLGNTFQELGRLEEAEASHRQAISLKPDYAEAHSNLGMTLRDLGRLEEAEASFRQAIALKPDYAEAHSNWGMTLRDLGRLEEAEASVRQAIALKPGYAKAHSNLGVTLRDLGRLKEAEASVSQAISLKPDYAEAHSHLGMTLRDLGRLEEAEASVRQAISLKPDFVEAHSNLGMTLRDLDRFEEAEASYRQAISLKPDFVKAHSNLLFSQSSRAFDSALHLKEALNYANAISKKISSRFAEWSCVEEPQRLRIGFVSGDFKNHPVGYFLEGLLTQFNPSSVELFAYPTHFIEDELTARIKPRFASWAPLFNKSDKEAARLIHNDGIHILIDLSGHTAKNRLPIFAWKPAPIQISWLGYWATTGVPEIDYLLGDSYVTPYEEANHFTEKIWQLPESFLCLTEPNVTVEVEPLPALSTGTITFGCFNNLAKMTDEVVALRAKVLKTVPGSKLFLKSKQLGVASRRDAVLERFSRHGITADRLILEGSSPRAEYLASYNRMDIALSPFPYGGTTTSAEGLWMGVPMLTKRGDRFLSHIGETIAHNVGLSDWIATDEDEYVAKAVAFSSDLKELAKIRAGLRGQLLSSPLFNSSRFVNHFEKAFWSMWELWKEDKIAL